MAGAGYGGWVLLPSPRMTSCWYILNTPSETPTSLHHYSVCKRIKVWGVKFNLRNVNISVYIQNTKKKSPFWSSHPCITWSGSLPTPAPGSGGLTFFLLRLICYVIVWQKKLLKCACKQRHFISKCEFLNDPHPIRIFFYGLQSLWNIINNVFMLKSELNEVSFWRQLDIRHPGDAMSSCGENGVSSAT